MHAFERRPPGSLRTMDIVAALFSIAMLMLLLRFWSPKKIWQFEHQRSAEDSAEANVATITITARQSRGVVATSSICMHAPEDGPEHQSVDEHQRERAHEVFALAFPISYRLCRTRSAEPGDPTR